MRLIKYPSDRCVFITILIILVIVSGCLSQQSGNYAGINLTDRQTPVIQSPITTTEKNWIRIVPFSNFTTDTMFNITGSSILNVTGTTNFPEGTELQINLQDETKHRDVLRTHVKITSDTTGGPNSFCYTYDMKGNPPGQYRLVVEDDAYKSVAVIQFSIISPVPYYKSIQIDPVINMHIDTLIPVSGTTDLPPGSEITISTGLLLHSCPLGSTPDSKGTGARSLCGGGCLDTGSSRQTIRVTEGSGGVNIWNTTINTTGWCTSEYYWINANANNWTNIINGHKEIRF